MERCEVGVQVSHPPSKVGVGFLGEGRPHLRRTVAHQYLRERASVTVELLQKPLTRESLRIADPSFSDRPFSSARHSCGVTAK